MAILVKFTSARPGHAPLEHIYNMYSVIGTGDTPAEAFTNAWWQLPEHMQDQFAEYSQLATLVPTEEGFDQIVQLAYRED